MLLRNKRNELLIYRATALNLEGIMLNGKKRVSKITVYFHLYDFLERGRKTPTTENSTGLPGAVSEGGIMARRD